ncbi:MAG: hypothetical protein H0T46_15390 [Deltaproteobacteria bacterium]|nr:hypothetical protein [Deltaproteobacteria bacterium]
MRAVPLFVLLAACATPVGDDAAEDADDKGDRGTSTRFTEVDPTRSTKAFRTYIGKALDVLAANRSELAQLTLKSIQAGHVKIDELADLTCADFERVRSDLPDAGLTPDDYAHLRDTRSSVRATIENELDGYMWSNRIYVARGRDSKRLAATLIHEVNHVVNRSEVGYYDDLPTSAFIHEYRAFYLEAQFDPSEYEGIDLVDHVITSYELDRSKIKPAVLANPVTERLLPTAAAWKARKVSADVETVPPVCR